MGFLDRLLGRDRERQTIRQQQYAPPAGQAYGVPAPSGGASVGDEQAIARYKYLLRTAPPEDIEKMHAEAFAQLSPEQRQMVLQRMSEDLPQNEQPRTDSPQDMARAATRAEMRNPGYLQQSFGRGGGMGVFGSSMLGTISGVLVGSMLANALLGDYSSSAEAAESGDTASDIDSSGDASGTGDAGDASSGASDTGGTDAGSDVGGSDVGSDFGSGADWGSDFGGGDFGGGDFGGFDF